MSHKTYSDWHDTEEKVSMSQKIGSIKKFKDLVESACLHVEERELIAWFECYELIVPEDKEFGRFLKTVGIPVMRKVGRAKWYRSEVSDLGLALSTRRRPPASEDTSKILKET